MCCFKHYDSIYVYVLEKEIAPHSSILTGMTSETFHYVRKVGGSGKGLKNGDVFC